jgi:hypothetical protein
MITDKSLLNINAGIPECQKKFSPASAFLPVVNFVIPALPFWHRHSGIAIPASPFRHQGQSGVLLVTE